MKTQILELVKTAAGVNGELRLKDEEELSDGSVGTVFRVTYICAEGQEHATCRRQ